ncbi:hypothetical protein REPUB_Repub04eG0052400 [Reevesia pubescens]
MKIWCDVCGKEEAMVFCSADEAALCESCDRRVHHANKLASKHSRFSLLHPSFKDSPLCDICQERRAFLFCQEDRAILCIECDLSIHRANEHNQKHNRFLLTGVELSSSSNVDSETKSSQSSKRFHSVSDNEIFSSPSTETPLPASTTYRAEDNCTNETASISTSNISEYLMETLPGWHVDDFLEPSSASNGFCKTFEQLLPVKGLSCFSSEEIWVHEVSPPQSSQLSLFIPENDLVDGLKKLKEAKENAHIECLFNSFAFGSR